MASVKMNATLTVCLKNKRALRALVRAAELLEELHGDFPYRPEIKQAQKALRYAAKNLTVENVKTS